MEEEGNENNGNAGNNNNLADAAMIGDGNAGRASTMADSAMAGTDGVAKMDIDDLQKQSAAALRRGVVAGKVPVNGQLVDTLNDSMEVDDNPGLGIEAARGLLVVGNLFNKAAICNLMERLSDEHERAEAGAAVRAIIESSEGDDTRHLLLGAVVRGIKEDDPGLQLKWTDYVGRIICIKPDPPVQVVVETGIVPNLVGFLERDGNPDLQFTAAGVLGDIANDSPHHRDLVLESGAMPLLATLALTLRDSVHELRLNVPYAIRCLCGGEPSPAFKWVRPALPALAQLINDEDEDVVEEACRALSYVALVETQAVIDAEVCPRIVDMLRHPSPTVQEQVMIVVGNLLRGSEVQVQVLIVLDVLPTLQELLASTDSRTQELACWCIARICRFSEQVQAVIDNGIVPLVIQHLGSNVSIVQEDAARAIRRFTKNGSLEQVQALVEEEEECIPLLCGLLTADASENQVWEALEALANILYAGWKLGRVTRDARIARFPGTWRNSMVSRFSAEERSKVQELQRHPDDDIRQLACDVFTVFFGGGETIAEAVGAGGNGDGM